MITRPRQISLLQITLHFSCTVAAPQTGQRIAEESAAPSASAGGGISGLGSTLWPLKT
jgi:hypothetical protein